MVLNRILFLYGTQTGNSKDVANDLNRLVSCRNFSSSTCGLDEYDLHNLPNEECTVFIVSTTGDGEVPGLVHEALT